MKTRRPLEKSKKIFIEKEKKKEEEIKRKEETKKKNEGKQKDILKQIESYDHLKVLVNTTGVYIALYDLKSFTGLFSLTLGNIWQITDF